MIADIELLAISHIVRAKGMEEPILDNSNRPTMASEMENALNALIQLLLRCGFKED
jgi:hypothetical protein